MRKNIRRDCSWFIKALGLTNHQFDLLVAKQLTVIFFGETGNEPDEEGSLLLLAGLKKLGVIHKLVIIANRLPVLERAQVARGTMDVLGLPETVVAMGEPYGHPQTNHAIQFGAPYKSTATNFRGYHEVFWKTLLTAEDRSVLIVLAGGMADMAELLKPDTKASPMQEGLLVAKVAVVSIMGGVVVKGEEEELAADQFGAAVASWDAVNNAHAWMTTYVVRTRLQALGIKTVDVAKSTAYATAVSRDIYDQFAKTGHPVGIRLQTMSEAMIQHLWERCHLPADDVVGREGLVGHLDPLWFSTVFCGGNPMVLKLTSKDRIWPFILTFQLYDQLAVLAAFIDLRKIHFEPLVFTASTGAVVESIGTTRPKGTRTNVRNPEATRLALVETMMAGLLL